MPRLTCSGFTTTGLPSTSANELFISGWSRERLDQRVADEVGEADLAAAPAGEVVVDHDAVVGQQLRRHRAHAGRGRDVQRGVHVLDDPGGDAAQRGGLGALGDLGRSPWRPAWPRRASPRALAAAGSAAGLAGCGGGGRLAWAPSSAVALRLGGGRRGRGVGARLRGGRAPRAGRGLGRPRGAAARRRSPAGSRRRSRATPGRRSPGRRGSAGTSPRRSTRSGRSPPVGCPAMSAAGSTRPVSPLPRGRAECEKSASRLRRDPPRTAVTSTPCRAGRLGCYEMSRVRVIKVPTTPVTTA